MEGILLKKLRKDPKTFKRQIDYQDKLRKKNLINFRSNASQASNNHLVLAITSSFLSTIIGWVPFMSWQVIRILHIYLPHKGTFGNSIACVYPPIFIRIRKSFHIKLNRNYPQNSRIETGSTLLKPEVS